MTTFFFRIEHNQIKWNNFVANINKIHIEAINVLFLDSKALLNSQKILVCLLFMFVFSQELQHLQIELIILNK